MRKLSLILILIFSANLAAQAQIEDTPEDSISFYLGKKWEEQARFLGGLRVQSFGEKLRYDFKANNTFVKSTGKKKEKGNWRYRSDKKVIELLINERIDFFIVRLMGNQLLLAAELDDKPTKSLGILVLLKAVD